MEKSRVPFVDNLRVLLIALVVLHHTAGVYSGLPVWYYTETPDRPALGLLLTVFLLLDQAWFMGAFFLLSGLFTRASFDRKGPRAFLRDRLVRLGIPLLVFYFLINPLLYLGSPHEGSLFSAYRHAIGAGPLWFVLALLVFDAAYAAFRVLFRDRPVVPGPPALRWALAFVLGLAVVTYALRIVIPLGFWVPVIDFPTAAYLPQYASFFALGIVASRRAWLTELPARLAWAGLALAGGATLVFLPLALAGGTIFGGGTVSSLCYALWDSSFAVGLLLGLTVLFRRRFATQGRLRRYLSAHVFTVYVIHAIVVTAVVRALSVVDLPTAAKAGIAAAVVLPACFALAGPVRRLPGVRRVL